MPEPMTPDQMKIFIGAAQMGMACGLEHPWEWLANAERALVHGPWADLGKNTIALHEAFLAWWHGCGSHPGDYCETATVEQMIEEINRWYQRGRNESTQPPVSESGTAPSGAVE